ncbi:hypothetical protein ACH47B_06465 [Rhodococcus sp. NPDC019627]|uniref:hypothetical protein n=1 Tax=unclassified Rhodococcus (in: high G+C Gram-positive bacteria) TaxID=192944 RepID=UPI0037AB85B7
MAAIEYQHVVGEWRITDYDSRDDVDAIPETNTLKGRVTFSAKWDERDRFATIRVPEDGDAESFALSVRPMVFPVVAGRLQDREARDGVMLPAVAGGVPIVWTATPELFEDPGLGMKGDAVRADPVIFGPPVPAGDGSRTVNLADVVNGTIEYPEPIVSQVAALVQDAEAAKTEAETAAGLADASADAAASSANASAGSAGAAAATLVTVQAAADAAAGSATAAAGSAGAAASSAAAADTSEAAAAGSASAASSSATAADGSADAAALSADAAADSATAAAGSATAAAGSAATAGTEANRAQTEANRAQAAADAAEVGAPAGGWTEAELSASVNASLDKADTALQSVPAHTHTTAQVTGLDTALAGKADLVGGQIVTSQLPAVAISSRTVVADRPALLALTAQEGDVGIITSGADRGSYILGSGPANNFASWALMVAPADAVSSVNNQTGAVNLGAADVGAAPAVHTHTTAQVTGLDGALAGKAPAHQLVASLPATGTAGVLYLIAKA